MAELNYQTNPNEPESTFDVVPAGEYIAVIESSDYAPNKAGTGKILKLTYQIIDGPMKGRKLFENLNLENQSKQAEEIARKTLNSIGIATGVSLIKDSSQLHDTPMKIDVSVKDDQTYGPQNRIKKHTKIEGSTPAPSQPAQAENSPQPASEPAQVAGAKKPWEQ